MFTWVSNQLEGLLHSNRYLALFTLVSTVQSPKVQLRGWQANGKTKWFSKYNFKIITKYSKEKEIENTIIFLKNC